MVESWDDVAVEVTERVAASIEPVARKAADGIYERLMETAQDYLADNIRFNLSSRLQSAEREAAALRLRVWRLDNTVVPALLEALQFIARERLPSGEQSNASIIAAEAIALALSQEVGHD